MYIVKKITRKTAEMHDFDTEFIVWNDIVFFGHGTILTTQCDKIDQRTTVEQHRSKDTHISSPI